MLGKNWDLKQKTKYKVKAKYLDAVKQDPAEKQDHMGALSNYHKRKREACQYTKRWKCHYPLHKVTSCLHTHTLLFFDVRKW